jgi:hypothetical protein
MCILTEDRIARAESETSIYSRATQRCLRRHDYRGGISAPGAIPPAVDAYLNARIGTATAVALGLVRFQRLRQGTDEFGSSRRFFWSRMRVPTTNQGCGLAVDVRETLDTFRGPVTGMSREGKGADDARTDPQGYRLGASRPPSQGGIGIAEHGSVAVMGELGEPSRQARLRLLVDDPDPAMRLTVAAALYLCGERDGELWSAWISREQDLAVFAVLCAVAGSVPLTQGALDHLVTRAEDAGTSAEVRGGAVWAVAQHDRERGVALARQLLVHPGAAFVLSSMVRRRGGPLALWIIAVRGDPATDHIADQVCLRHPARG